jgi:hypothetical protein
MKIYYLRSLITVALVMFSLEVQALVITTTTIGVDACDSSTCWSGTTPNNPDADDVSSITGVADLVSLYKADVPDTGLITVESGLLTSSYETSFSPVADPLDPENAFISYVGEDYINCPECFLVVKDGNNDPIWYIFDIGSWDGIEAIEIQNFWPGQGGISHVDILGRSVGVPEPSILALFGLGLIGIGLTRRKV